MEFIELYSIQSVFLLHVLSAFLLDIHENVRIKCLFCWWRNRRVQCLRTQSPCPLQQNTWDFMNCKECGSISYHSGFGESPRLRACIWPGLQPCVILWQKGEGRDHEFARMWDIELLATALLWLALILLCWPPSLLRDLGFAAWGRGGA